MSKNGSDAENRCVANKALETEKVTTPKNEGFIFSDLAFLISYEEILSLDQKFEFFNLIQRFPSHTILLSTRVHYFKNIVD